MQHKCFYAYYPSCNFNFFRQNSVKILLFAIIDEVDAAVSKFKVLHLMKKSHVLTKPKC
jgi:hypothetical protein